LNIARVTADSMLMQEEKKNKQEAIVPAKIPKITWFSFDLFLFILTPFTRAN
jgi:hypothetical protein